MALTPRHREILDLLVEGKSNAEIGEALHIAEKTVKNYVSQVLALLKVPNRTAAALYWASSPREAQMPEEVVELVLAAHEAGRAEGLRQSMDEVTIAAHLDEARQAGRAEGWHAAIEHLRRGQVAP
jgi:DNA-binding CsgD family transcriptional regulator